MAKTMNPDDVDRIAVPDTPEGLESFMGDPTKMASLLGNGDALAQFVRNYARVVLDKDQSIATQVREETAKHLQDFFREQREQDGAAPIPFAARADWSGASPSTSREAQRNRKMGLYNPRAMGACLDKEGFGASDFFNLIWHNKNRDAREAAKVGKIRNAFSSTVPSEGGFLIPETLRSELLRVSLESGIVRQRSRVIPMETLRVPFPSVDSTSNVSSVFGGIVGYWTEEGGQLQASQAAFGRVTLEAKKLTAYTVVPNELIADSQSSFEMFISDMFPEALAWYEDDAFLNGNGVGMPLGILRADAMIEVPKETNQGADTIVWQNIIKMYARMLPQSLNRAVWVVSPDTFPELATMALSVGTGGSAIWLNNGVEGPPASILGRPVIVSEKVPGLGDDGDINFVDFGYYLIGDRQVMSASSSQHFKFDTDETAYRIIQRVDGRPWLNSAITPKNNTATLSPFVQLADRA